jgi:predicted nicotinamide N-methyase
MNPEKVVILHSQDASLEDIDRNVIIANLETADETLIILQLEKLISWTSHDGLASKLRSLRITPYLIKLLSHENERIVEASASATSYMSGRSSAGPYYRHWNFGVQVGGVETTKTISIFEPAYSSGAGLGWKTWNAAIVLVEYFGQCMESFVGKDILELGCGTGLSGIFCAKFGARSVVMTDYNETVLETVALNASRNALPNVTFRRLDWVELIGQNSTAETQMSEIQPFDTIIGSDIVYDPEHAEVVPKVIDRLLSHNPCARAYISVGPRPESAKFQQIMVSEYGFEVLAHEEPVFVDSEGQPFHHDVLVYKRPASK